MSVLDPITIKNPAHLGALEEGSCRLCKGLQKCCRDMLREFTTNFAPFFTTRFAAANLGGRFPEKNICPPPPPQIPNSPQTPFRPLGPPPPGSPPPSWDFQLKSRSLLLLPPRTPPFPLPKQRKNKKYPKRPSKNAQFHGDFHSADAWLLGHFQTPVPHFMHFIL